MAAGFGQQVLVARKEFIAPMVFVCGGVAHVTDQAEYVGKSEALVCKVKRRRREDEKRKDGERRGGEREIERHYVCLTFVGLRVEGVKFMRII